MTDDFTRAFDQCVAKLKKVEPELAKVDITLESNIGKIIADSIRNEIRFRSAFIAAADAAVPWHPALDQNLWSPHARYPEVNLRRVGNLVEVRYQFHAAIGRTTSLWLNNDFYHAEQFEYHRDWRLAKAEFVCTGGKGGSLRLIFEQDPPTQIPRN